MSDVYLVYKHTAPNGKSYIGQTHNYQKRCKEHKNQKNCLAFYNAIQKYGWNNFKHEILKDNLTLDEVNLWEELYIKHFNTMKPNGYNLRSGGNHSKITEEAKKKIGNANRGRIKTEEERKKLATWTGKKHTEEQKYKIGKAHKGKIITEETRERMREASKKRMANPDLRKQISDKLMGHKRTQESIEKTNAANKGRKMSASNKEALRLGNIARRQREKEMML